MNDKLELLKECPFCGGKPYIHGSTEPRIICNECRAQGQPRWELSECIELWNRRALPDLAKVRALAKAEAFEEAIQKCEDYANEGLAAPIMRELRSIYVMRAAALRKETT